MLIVLLSVVVATVAVTMVDHHRRMQAMQPNGQPQITQPQATTRSPIKLAILANFPDPALCFADGKWFAYATNNAAGVLGQGGTINASAHITDFGRANVQLASSADFVNWTMSSYTHQPLPDLGRWTASRSQAQNPAMPQHLSNTWAPAVIQRDDGNYVMYYSATVQMTVTTTPISGAHPPPHCVGAAVSDSAMGPFQPLNDSLACPIQQGGAIDPEAMKDDDGTVYVVYKIDGNNFGHGGECGNTVPPIQSTPIMLQKMKADAVTPDGPAMQILDRTDSDGPLVEAPMLVRSHEGVYFLFFSSGCTRSPSYTVKYATAEKIDGPYTRAHDTLLETGSWGLQAPGSIGVAKNTNGEWAMALHARVNIDEVGDVRAMFTTKLVFSGHTAVLVEDKVK